jgi:hypothetical protein
LVLTKGKVSKKTVLTTVLSDVPSVYYRLVVEVLNLYGRNGLWLKILDKDTGVDSFQLEDESGSLDVFARGAELKILSTDVLTTLHDDELPENVRQFIGKYTPLTTGVAGKRTLRITEYSISPGQTIHVLGTVNRNYSDKTNYLCKSDESSPFIIANSEDEIKQEKNSYSSIMTKGAWLVAITVTIFVVKSFF